MTLREAASVADPNEPRRLKSGRVVTLQQMIDSLDAWEKRSNARLSSLAKRLPVPASTQARLAASGQQLNADLTQQRSLAAAGWRNIIDRPAGTAKTFRPSVARKPDGQPLIPTAVQTTRRPHPQTEPFDTVWSRQWGDPSDIAAELDASFGNEFQFDDRSGPSAGCVGVVQVNAWLLGGSLELARVYGGAASTDRQVQGSAAIYITGIATPFWQQSRAFPIQKLERSYQTPSVDAPIATVEPVTVDAILYGTGTALIDVGITPHVAPGRDFGCAVTVAPQVQAVATGGAKAVPMAGVNDVLDVLLGEVSAGLEANVTLLNLQLPGTLSADIRQDPRNRALIAFEQNASLGLNANILSGQLIAFLEIDLNDFWSFVASIFDSDSTERWAWDLHDWQGYSFQMDLGQVHNSIPFVQ